MAGPEVSVAVCVKVVGRVQRTGYRRYVLDVAQDLGVAGYARNLPDGSMEIFAQAREEALNIFLEKIKKPPHPAAVKDVYVERKKPKPELKVFGVKYGPMGEELQEGFGAMQTVFTDYWKEFRDYREEFRDFRGEFKDYRQEFKDYREEFRDYRQEFRGFAERTDESFKLLFDRYGEISEKLTTLLETFTKESQETRKQLTRAVELLTKAIEKLLK